MSIIPTTSRKVQKVGTDTGMEWQLVCIAYNLKRLHIVGAGLKLAGQP